MSEDNKGQNAFILNFVRSIAAGATAKFVSLYGALAVPCSFFGFYTLHLIKNPIGLNGEKSKVAVGSYIMTNMFLFNIFMILAFEDYNSDKGPNDITVLYFYLGLLVNGIIDFYLLKKPLHKLGHRCTNKELKKEYKVAKRQKKKQKLEQLHRVMENMSPAEKQAYLQTLSFVDKGLFEKAKKEQERIRIYRKMMAKG